MKHRAWLIVLVALTASCAGCAAPPPPPPPPVVAAVAPMPAAAPADCREFRQTITVGGAATEGWGTTCLQPDGRWKVMAAPTPQPQVAAAPVAVYPYYAYAYPYPYYYPVYGHPPAFFGGVAIGRRFR